MSPSPLLALPRCVTFRSKLDNKSYLRSVHDESHGGSLVELGHGDGGIMSPRARFYLEPSKEHEGLMHVRCCYNNKYWVPQQRVLPGAAGGGGGGRWVIGTTHEPEEDLSKPSCTLHKLEPIAGEQAEDDDTCRFLHSKLGKYACAVPSISMRSYMHIASNEAVDCLDGGGLTDALTVIDVSDQKQLPKYVAFKGDNDCFLEAFYDYHGHHLLNFVGHDIGSIRVLNTISTNDDGVVRIQSNFFGKFWRGPNWFLVDSSDTTFDNPYTTFRVITGNDFIALQNLGNNQFCKRVYNEDTGTFCLTAPADSVSITDRARLRCYEPVVSRKMYNVDFHLGEAKTYTTAVKGLDSQTVKNRGSQVSHQTLSFSWTSKVESTWSSTVSIKIGIDISIECGVPFFVEEKIDISTEFSASYTWGETKTEEKAITRSVDVQVPPMKKVIVRAIGTNGVCDIPFSYKQKDVLTNGQEVIHNFTDGLYKGVKTSDVKFEIIEEDL